MNIAEHRRMRAAVADSVVTLGHVAFEGFADPERSSEQLGLLLSTISELQDVADKLRKQAECRKLQGAK